MFLIALQIQGTLKNEPASWKCVVTVMYLKIQVLQDMTLCPCVSSPRCFKGR